MAFTKSEQTAFPIQDLSPEIREMYIYSNFSMVDVCLFARSYRVAEQESRRSRLLHYAVNAMPFSYQQEDKTMLAAINMLQKHPELLFLNGKVKDHAGHLIYGSAYRVFLGAGDIWALMQVHKKIIPCIPRGEDIAREQYKQQFPRYDDTSLKEEERLYDERNIIQIAQIKEDLEDIVAAFSNDQCINGSPGKQRTRDAIKNLHAHFHPKDGEVIETGLYSPPEIMKMIYDVFYQHFLIWSEGQRRLYSLDVIGKGEVIATAVDAQCYTKGLSLFDVDKGPDRTISYFPVEGDVGRMDSFFVDVYDGAPSYLHGRYSCSAQPVSWDTMSSKRIRTWYADASGSALNPLSVNKR